MAAELDIPVFINLSNRNIILHDVLMQLHNLSNGKNINHGQSRFFGFGENILMHNYFIFFDL